MHLCSDIIQYPASFARVEEVYAESGYYGVRCACLLPVVEEWVEVVACEIHHGEDHVLVVLAEPELRVLPDGMVAVPSARAVSARIAIFAYGRTAQFDPWLDRFDDIVHSAYYASDVVASPVCE